MERIRDRYRSISFRGRLLLLLIAVSLVQASVASYTFFDLQSKPAEQRVQAQLNAALRGVAPVIDTQLNEAGERLRELQSDPTLQSAIEAEDWVTVDAIVGGQDAAAGE